MDEPPANVDQRKYAWPWFLLAAVIAAFLLGFVWMNAAVKRLRNTRIPSTPSLQQTNPGGAVSSNSLPPASATNDIISGFREALSGGNAKAGRKIFFEKPEASCAKCHQIEGLGGGMGPPLDGIGARRSRETLLEAMLNPNCRTLEGYESIILLLKNGTGCAGLLKRESETELVVLTAEDSLMTIQKSDIQIRQRGMSPMPEGLGQLLSRQELGDLVEFMAGLQ
jgi:quinoprotein glucose dehydrogenase